MKYAVSELKARLTQVLREVEKGTRVEVTRHGKSVAVIIAKDDYEDLAGVPPSFSASLDALRGATDFSPLEGELENLRDKGAGREVDF